MSVEVLGFIAGAVLALASVLWFRHHGLRREIDDAYGRGRPGRRPGNALIWPSH